MNPLIKAYKKLTYTDWRIAFAENSLESIVNGEDIKLHVMTSDFDDRWFADPFILDVTDSEIIVLAEVVSDDTRRGRIAKLIVDRKTYHLKEMKYILDLKTHLSFPVIVREGNKILVYPENGESGALKLYEMDAKTDLLINPQIIMPQFFADAIITDIFGDRYMFVTDKPDVNGSELYIYKFDVANGTFVLDDKVTFNDKIARMAGEFFKIGDKIYRPAQECNEDYGHGMVIQEVSHVVDKWEFKEVRRMTSPLKRWNMCFHTLNSYKGVVVTDVKGFRHYHAGRLLKGIKDLLKRGII